MWGFYRDLVPYGFSFFFTLFLLAYSLLILSHSLFLLPCLLISFFFSWSPPLIENKVQTGEQTLMYVMMQWRWLPLQPAILFTLIQFEKYSRSCTEHIFIYVHMHTHFFKKQMLRVLPWSVPAVHVHIVHTLQQQCRAGFDGVSQQRLYYRCSAACQYFCA